MFYFENNNFQKKYHNSQIERRRSPMYFFPINMLDEKLCFQKLGRIK